MSIDMYLGPSKTQGSTTTSVCNNYQSGLTGLQEAISNFTADQVLRSLAYDSAKGYFQEAYVPLIQGAILVVEVTSKAVEKLPTDYVAQVDSCDLKSSELEREIQQYEVQIQGMQEQIEQVKELLPVSSERVQHIREANGLISDYTNAKAKLEKQLQKLLAFHAFSTMIFVEVTSLKNAIDQGLAQVSGGKGFNAQKGTFSNGNLKDRSWMDTIGKKWQEREKERLKDQMPNMDGLEYKQIDFNGGKVWCWVKEGHTTADPEDIEKTFLYNDWVARMLKKYGSDYFTPEREPGVMDLLVEQNLRLFEELRTGIDSKTGKKLTPLERLARGTSLANSLAALGVGAKQITNVGRGKSSQSPTKSPIINRGPRVNDIGKSNKTITLPGKKIQSVKGKPSKVKAPGKASGANSPKTDFGAENPVSGKDWNNYFKNKYGAGNVHWKNPVSSISELMDTPGSLINVNPADVTDFVKREGWTVTPLKKGGSAGIPYEEGGGFSMNPPKGTSGDSRYIQYHPGNGHHGEVPYYKISQPNKPTVRIYMDGRYEID